MAISEPSHLYASKTYNKDIPGLKIYMPGKDVRRKGKKILYFFKEDYINEGNAFSKYFQDIQKNGFILNIIEDIENMGESCDLYSEVAKDLLNEQINLFYETLPIEEANKSILYASSLVKLEDSPDKGRLLVATEPIQRNKVLISEPPTVLQVTPLCNCSADKDTTFYRCHNCGTGCKIYYTCDGCNVCIFCSKNCLYTAYRIYHRFECYGLQRHFWSMDDTDYSYLSMRMMLYGAAKEFESQPEIGGCYGSRDNNYPFIYMLETNFSQLSLVKLNKILYSATKNLMYLIMKTVFFEQFKNKNWNLHDLYLYIGGLLVKHYCQAQTNNVLLKYPNLASSYGLNLVSGTGKAICPTIALLNHSCSPNSALIISSDHILVKSLKPIKQGEEVTICYSEINSLLTVAERQTITEEIFYFTCNCSFCNFEKSMMEAPFRCPHCIVGNAKQIDISGVQVGFCLKCNRQFSMDEIRRNIKVATICRNLCSVTYSIEHLTRIAECYSVIFPENSLQLLDVYKLLYEKHVLWGEKPLEVIKYGLLLFNIVEHCTSRLYLPLLISKVRFFGQIVEMQKFPDIKNVNAGEFETIRIFVREVDKVNVDLVFYLPAEKLQFYQPIRLKVHRMFDNVNIDDENRHASLNNNNNNNNVKN